MTGNWSLTIPAGIFRQLHAHLFQDDDEHGAVMIAGVARQGGKSRLLARDLLLARDGIEYVAGERGYRMLTAAFVRDGVLRARDEGMAYIAVHNHGGTDHVAFSPDDMASHERGYPALLGILGGAPVIGLVLAKCAAAGDVWDANGDRSRLVEVRVVGRPIRRFASAPAATDAADVNFDRQTRLLGDRGQALLSAAHVGVIGAGGVGSLVVEYLSRLGVGRITVADPDRVDATNLARIPGSRRSDVRRVVPSRRKVSIVARLAREANPRIQVDALFGDFLDPAICARFLSCDYVFLAADTMSARLLFNAVTQQYLIPGVQVGSKIDVEADSGRIRQAFSVVRPVTHDGGCLWCNGLIPPGRLQAEAEDAKQLERQRYVADIHVNAPSVISMNAVGSAFAVNDFLFSYTGIAHSEEQTWPAYLRADALTGEVFSDMPSADPECPECGSIPSSRRAKGDKLPLPTLQPRHEIQRIRPQPG